MNTNQELNNINDFVSYVKVCKSDMRDALISKGVTVPVNTTLDAFAEKISSISGGGGTFLVEYLDWDDSVLKSQNVLPGGDVLSPFDPTREAYTFTGWDGVSLNVQMDLVIHAQYNYTPLFVQFIEFTGNLIRKDYVNLGDTVIPPTAIQENMVFSDWCGSYTNITENRTVIARYATSLNRTYMTIVLDATTGPTPQVRLWTGPGGITIYWGDGQSSTTNAFPLVDISHTYGTYGTYVISIAGTQFTVGEDDDVDLHYPALSLVYMKSLKSVKHYRATSAPSYVSGYAFSGAINLTDIKLPEGMLILKRMTFSGCTSLQRLILPNSLTSIGTRALEGLSAMKSLVIPINVPPTLPDSVTIMGFHANFKLYVPDLYVDTYKAASYYSVIASRIYGISTYIE